MKQALIGGIVGAIVVATVFVSIAVFAQDNIVSFVRPLIVDVRQSVPVLADVVVPLDGGTSITATIPLTVDIALQVGISGVVSESVQVAETEPEVSIATPAPESSQGVIAVAQDVELIYGGVKWTIVNAQNAGGEYDDPDDNFRGATTSDAFVVVSFTIENTGNSPVDTSYGFEYGNAYAIVLRDTDGRQFNPFENGYIPRHCRSVELNPGLSKSCNILFEVPKIVSGFTVIFQAEEGDEQVVDLGL